MPHILTQAMVMERQDMLVLGPSTAWVSGSSSKHAFTNSNSLLGCMTPRIADDQTAHGYPNIEKPLNRSKVVNKDLKRRKGRIKKRNLETRGAAGVPGMTED